MLTISYDFILLELHFFFVTNVGVVFKAYYYPVTRELYVIYEASDIFHPFSFFVFHHCVSSRHFLTFSQVR